ncbi:protein PHLOEM PROTEIN 2-LIKE A1-like [Malania oleifera]|uniref:protein PHLOEM PROTEIN 2-LIKE A1-like n=1 Tax=Malania oleifera TaxID=397392 RepID=UPI0025AE8183|nr:protein PHLOEM PROTEIN 2-LIKE A1-like [Malania oleifera]
MDCPPRNGHSNPHWQSDGSYMGTLSDGGSYRIPARALNIVWGNDPRYWQWIQLREEESRLVGFKEGAMLIQVNWIQMTMSLDLSVLKVSMKYTIYYIVKFKADAFGWHSAPIKFKVKMNGEKERVQSIVLQPYREKQEEWHKIYGGEFWVSKDITTTTTTGNNHGHVEFGMFEIDTDWWKGGMVLAGIVIEPKVC